MAFLKSYSYFILILVLSLVPVNSYAGDKLLLQEQEIKAGLIYNFLKYTQWPQEKKVQNPSTIELCVFGKDPFKKYLEPMKKRTVNQQKINVRSINLVQESEDCNLVFISSEKKSEWANLSNFFKGKNILTVSDFEGFATSGGIIEFGIKNNHINAELNMNTLKLAQLRVEDRLLKLVSIVDN